MLVFRLARLKMQKQVHSRPRTSKTENKEEMEEEEQVSATNGYQLAVPNFTNLLIPK